MYFEIMKKFIIGALMALITFSAAAQNEVRAFEFEISGGHSAPLYNLPGDEIRGTILNLELRHNLKNIPIDIGFELNVTTVYRKKPNTPPRGMPNLTNSAISFTTSYNFARGKDLSLFIGIGAGIPITNILFLVHNYYYNTDLGPYLNMAFSPRIGIEMYNHFRISMDIRLLDKENSAIALRAGIVFGGGKKPIKNQAKNLF